MIMEGVSTHLRSPELEPHQQMQFSMLLDCVYPEHYFFVVILIVFRVKQSAYSKPSNIKEL